MLNRIKKNTKLNDDMKISIAIVSSSVILIFQYFLLSYFNLFGSNQSHIIQNISKLLVIAAYLIPLPIVIKKSKFTIIKVYFIFALVFILQLIMFPKNWELIKTIIFHFFFMSVPVFIYSLSLDSYVYLRKVMNHASKIIFFIGVLIGILSFSGIAHIEEYSMPLSYYLLFPTILFIDEFFKKISLKMFIQLLVSLVIIISLGSRGPLLCIIIFIILRVPMIRKNYTYKKLGFILITLLIFMLFYIEYEKLIFDFNLFLNKFGINSRTLTLILQGGIQLSGREYIFQNTISAIFNNSLFGYGLMGDRLIFGAYPHNIFLEIIGDFGIIAGFIIIIYIILLIIKALLTKIRTKYSFYIIWISIGFVPLLISGSYLLEINFWILMGLLINKNIINDNLNKIEMVKTNE